MSRPAMPISERYWDKVEIGPGCWIWTGSKTSDGYGQIGYKDNKRYKAHRISWKMHYGPIPDRLCVLHKCDIPLCVKPTHLFLGTRADNARDMLDKDRGSPPPTRRGEKNNLSKLTEEKVRDIRSMYETGKYSYKQLGELFDVDKSNIGYIINRTTWGWVK